MTVYHVNAFTLEGDGGNPAGVVLDADQLTSEEMQKIAHQLGFSETAFIVDTRYDDDYQADFRIRFFTPNTEVDFCGHATLASFAILHKKSIVSEGCYVQQTKAGLLTVEVNENGSITQQQTLPQFLEKIPPIEIAQSLGLSVDSLTLDKYPIQCVTTGLVDIIIPVEKGLLDSINPDHQAIMDICRRYNAIGFHLFELDSAGSIFTANCRNFAPLVDIPEESATGSASGALAAYLHKYSSKHPISFRFEQGRAMHALSEIFVSLSVTDDEIDGVYVSGYGELVKTIPL
ncbi:PhzF family phenazine biosynthesis protein [Thalassotalea fusca]